MKITSVEQYITKVKEITNILRSEELHTLWFRAENIGYNTTLKPSFYRQEKFIKEFEDHLIINEKGLKLLNSIEGTLKSKFSINKHIYSEFKTTSSNWETYYLMQHYGISTRLLDWTESALIALFFCVENLNLENDGIVWLLNPFKLNQINMSFITNKNKGYDLDDFEYYAVFNPMNVNKKNIFNKRNKLKINRLFKNYLDLSFKDKLEFYPLAISPTRFDMRMKNQKSNFTIFGNKPNGLLSNIHKDLYLDKIIIERESFKEIKEDLSVLGINYESIYPGLEGVAKDVMFETLKLFKD